MLWCDVVFLFLNAYQCDLHVLHSPIGCVVHYQALLPSSQAVPAGPLQRLSATWCCAGEAKIQVTDMLTQLHSHAVLLYSDLHTFIRLTHSYHPLHRYAFVLKSHTGMHAHQHPRPQRTYTHAFQCTCTHVLQCTSTTHPEFPIWYSQFCPVHTSWDCLCR